MLMRSFFGYHLWIGIVGLMAVLLGIANIAEAQEILGCHRLIIDRW